MRDGCTGMRGVLRVLERRGRQLWQRHLFAFTPVGQGDCDNAAVVRALNSIGYDHWSCNEPDAWADGSVKNLGQPACRFRADQPG